MKMRLVLIAALTLLSATLDAQIKRPWIPFEDFSFRKDTVSVVLVGDLMMHGPQSRDAFRVYSLSHPGADSYNHDHYDFTTFLMHIKDRISSADLAIGNLEFTLAGPPFTGYPSFSAPDSYPEYITSCGFDVLVTANNHILDKGSEGLRRTIRTYDRLEARHNVVYTGISASKAEDEARYPIFVIVKGVKIAILNFTYGTNSGGTSLWPKVNLMRRDDISRALARAKAGNPDIIMAIPHWGVEYQHRHNQDQGEMARWLARNGVDVIVGHHPHVVQDIEILKVTGEDGQVREVPVVYSLGNAVSNQNDLPARLEALVKINIAVHGTQHKVVPAPEVTFLWCTKPGMVERSYSVLPVKEYIGRQDIWKVKEDYTNMVNTYRQVKQKTGIED